PRGAAAAGEERAGEGGHPREADADGDAFGEPRAARDGPDGERARDRGDRAADREVHLEQERDDHAGERGVRDRVAEKREAAEDDEHADRGAHDPDEDAADERTLHERERKRREEVRHGARRRTAAARRGGGRRTSRGG